MSEHVRLSGQDRSSTDCELAVYRDKTGSRNALRSKSGGHVQRRVANCCHIEGNLTGGKCFVSLPVTRTGLHMLVSGSGRKIRLEEPQKRFLNLQGGQEA